MDSLESIRKRAARFQPKELAKASGLSKPYITELTRGDKVNPSLGAFQKFVQGVEALENKAAADKRPKALETGIKKKPRKQTEVLQTPSRDKRRGVVAGGKA